MREQDNFRYPDEALAGFPNAFVISNALSQDPSAGSASSDNHVALGSSRLRFQNFFATPASPTSLEKIKVTREKVLFLLNVSTWSNLQSFTFPLNMPEEWCAAAEQRAVVEFGVVQEVAQIYSDQIKAEQVFIVFVRGDKYNDALMDRLLDRELRLLNNFQLHPITVHYFPYKTETSNRSLVRESAKLIFEG